MVEAVATHHNAVGKQSTVDVGSGLVVEKQGGVAHSQRDGTVDTQTLTDDDGLAALDDGIATDDDAVIQQGVPGVCPKHDTLLNAAL